MRKVGCRVLNWTGTTVWGQELGWEIKIRDGVKKWGGLFQEGGRV